MPLLFILNYLLAASGLALLALTIGLYVDYFYCQSKYFNRFIQKFVWIIIPTITVGSVVISLVYSEYFGFVPCSLCWLQRIALYPQALFAVMAFKTKESVYFPLYSLALSIFVFLVAIFHSLSQIVPMESVVGCLMPFSSVGSAFCVRNWINL